MAPLSPALTEPTSTRPPPPASIVILFARRAGRRERAGAYRVGVQMRY